jgi:hypothetical protein
MMPRPPGGVERVGILLQRDAQGASAKATTSSTGDRIILIVDTSRCRHHR